MSPARGLVSRETAHESRYEMRLQSGDARNPPSVLAALAVMFTGAVAAAPGHAVRA